MTQFHNLTHISFLPFASSTLKLLLHTNNVQYCVWSCLYTGFITHLYKEVHKPGNLQTNTGTSLMLTLILRRSRTGTVWFYTSTSNKRAARPKLYTESLTRDLKRMYSRFTLVRISINL